MINNFFWHQGSYYNQVKGVAMGTKYAPSVANILLGEWEEEAIFSRPEVSLVLYKRYIDELLVLWNGAESSLKEFIERINQNQYGRIFTATWSKQEVHFLDVTLEKRGNTINTKTFFKETDKNSFIPTRSCHHPQWLGAIAKGQFMRICRNCKRDDDYDIQSNILLDRFIEKGYNLDAIQKIKDNVKKIPRKDLLR